MEKLIVQMEERYNDYLQDESRMRGSAEKISFPQTENDVIDIINECRKNHVPVTIQGARTGITGAAVPAGGLILNMSKMNKITGIFKEGEHFYLEAEPGVILSDLNELLSNGRFDTAMWSEETIENLKQMREGEEVQFSPNPTESTATLGGMFANNAKGISGHYYGKMGNYVEEITMITSFGERWKIKRGDIVIDEAGCFLPNGSFLPAISPKSPVKYPLCPEKGKDLVDLIAGSEGMLGAVTSMRLRLDKKPKENWGVLFFFNQMEQAAEFVTALDHLAGNATIITGEIFDRMALDIVEKMKQQVTKLKAIPQIPSDKEAAVYVELIAERDTDAEEMLLEILEMFGQFGNEEDTMAASSQDEMEKFRLFRHAVPEGINQCVDKLRQKNPEFHKMGIDFACPQKGLMTLIKDYQRDLEEEKIPAVIFGHALDCHLHVNLLPDTRDAFMKAKTLLLHWADEIASCGGCLAEENGIGKLKSHIVCRHISEEVLNAMKTTQEIFDPEQLFNRHNMIE